MAIFAANSSLMASMISALSSTLMAFKVLTTRSILSVISSMTAAAFFGFMGEKVETRKEFIEKNAKYAVNLDY